MTLNDFISKVYYLNMDKDTQRRESILKTISSIGITKPIERVCGVKYDGDVPPGYFNSRGHYGCRKGHEKISEKIIMDGIEGYVLILEDDCVVTKLFNLYIEEVLDTLLKIDFDLFYFYPNGSKYKNKGPLISREGTYGTQALLLNTKKSQSYNYILKDSSLKNRKFINENCFNIVDILLKFHPDLVKYKCLSTLLTQDKRLGTNT